MVTLTVRVWARIPLAGGPDTVKAQVNVPAGRPAGFSVTVMGTGVAVAVPLAGLAEMASHPVAPFVMVKATLPPVEETLNVPVTGVGIPVKAVSESEDALNTRV